MGACLSCLIGNNNDDEFNENTSLLRNNNALYSNDYLQQEEQLKQQQRQHELNSIVSDLNENLIDVTSFLNTNTTTTNTTIHNLSNSHILTHSNNNLNSSIISTNQDNGLINNETILSSSTTNATLPYVYNTNEKLKVLQQLNDIDNSLKQNCKVILKEPLYLNF
ncbi:hypothetical protein DFJ63DRAFT_54104 [Scheffersomyces coipomensis]|uniref:uncharacterized protein n=1 Tax=Scheffersomyces coipomensis TaxID=1788519 RepID=UPI00315CE40F